MSAYARQPLPHQYIPQQQPRSFSQFPHQPDRSPLDLLSRVALEQYPSPPPQIPSPQTPSPPTPSPHPSLPIWPSQPTKPLHHYPPSNPTPPPPASHLPEIRLPPQFSHPSYPPQYDKSRPVYSSDFSPVSSDDGSSSHPARPPPDLPPRLTKVMRVSKEQTTVKTRTQPSRFCHICSRTSKKVGLVACGNFATGACRKVVCQKCFNDHNWDWQAALKLGSKWMCTHCRQACPDRAQCAIYKRTNERRREQQQQQRSTRGDSLGAIRGGHGRFINKQQD